MAKPSEVDVPLEMAVDQLVKYGRPLAAVNCLYYLLIGNRGLDATRTARALRAAVSSEEQLNSIGRSEVVDLIKALQSNSGTDPDDLLAIEWAYLPLLDRSQGVYPKTLERRLADDAAFFCQVVRLIFRSEKEDHPDQEPSEEARTMAANGYRLLSEWSTPPGSREDGSYDGEALVKWLDAVKSECAQTGHLEIAMTMVGQVLTHAPADPDKLWIHRAAAAELDAPNADDLRDGYCARIISARGVCWVDPSGEPEREIAQQYRRKADDVDTAGFTQFASILRGFADYYDREVEQIIARHQERDQ